MTNKTDFPTDFESVSWQQLAAILARYLSSALVSHQTEMSDETMHEALGCCHQVTKRAIAERAAPAEDVRAVVDEPNPILGYADSYRAMARQGVKTVGIWSIITDLERNMAPLYRQPPRPVVMPKRRTADSPEINQNGHLWWREEKAADFNACLDEFARLNPQ